MTTDCKVAIVVLHLIKKIYLAPLSPYLGMRLPKIKSEVYHVCIIACVYVQHVQSCSLNPFEFPI